MSSKETDSAPITYYGLDQPAMAAADPWETFYSLCLEWAEVARQRRSEKAREQQREQEGHKNIAPQEMAVPESKG